MDALERHGWPAEALAFFAGMEMDQMKETVGDLVSDWELEDFETLRRESKRQKLAQEREDRLFALDPVSFQKHLDWQDGNGKADLTDKAKGIQMSVGRSLLPRPVWPNRYSRRSAHEKDEDQRAKVEEAKRERLTRELVSLLERRRDSSTRRLRLRLVDRLTSGWPKDMPWEGGPARYGNM